MHPIVKKTLADNLAQELKNFIVKHHYTSGQKLPSTSVIAKNFGVGLPTLREALKKLDAMGVVEVKHGSGIYVGEHINSLFLMNPLYSRNSNPKKQLLDLIDARIQFEVSAVALACVNADEKQIQKMRYFLDEASKNIENDKLLSKYNMRFHQEISAASGNSVYFQIISVLSNIFQNEQLLLIDIFSSKEEDCHQHNQIYDAIKSREEQKAARLMNAHLQCVRKSIEGWDPEND